MHQKPETYFFLPSDFVPNSRLPVLIYRDILKEPTAASTKDQIEKNGWFQGGVFKTYKAHHFHSVTHECYAVFSGESKFLLGRGPLDDLEGSIEVMVRRGDVIVLPAGVSHCSIDDPSDFEYVGLYPEGSPKWDNNFCKADYDETRSKAEQARQVPIPASDPVYGPNGPLVKIWNQIDEVMGF